MAIERYELVGELEHVVINLFPDAEEAKPLTENDIDDAERELHEVCAAWRRRLAKQRLGKGRRASE